MFKTVVLKLNIPVSTFQVLGLQVYATMCIVTFLCHKLRDCGV